VRGKKSVDAKSFETNVVLQIVENRGTEEERSRESRVRKVRGCAGKSRSKSRFRIERPLRSLLVSPESWLG